jgi:hypothetical protein
MAARGRMVNNSISRDKDISELSNDSCRLFFTWWITHADCEGRVYADPELAKSIVVPRLTHITVNDVENYIDELAEKGFIILYECEGDKYAVFTEFEKNQTGLRKDREGPSEIPAPPQLPSTKEYNLEQLRSNSGSTTEQLRSNSGSTTEQLRSNSGKNRVKLKEVKLKEENQKIEKALDPFSIIQEEIEKITGYPPDGPASVDAINKIIKMGATVEDIRSGFDWLKANSSKQIRYYSSLVGPIQTAMAQRTQSTRKSINPYEGAKVYD